MISEQRAIDFGDLLTEHGCACIIHPDVDVFAANPDGPLDPDDPIVFAVYNAQRQVWRRIIKSADIDSEISWIESAFGCGAI